MPPMSCTGSWTAPGRDGDGTGAGAGALVTSRALRASHTPTSAAGTMTARYPARAPPCWATQPAISGIPTIAAAHAPLSIPNTVPSEVGAVAARPEPSASPPRSTPPVGPDSVASAKAIVETAARGAAVSTSARTSADARPAASAGISPAARPIVATALTRSVRTRAPRRTTAALTRM